ncbi:MAG: amino acid-binding protein [Pseudomonadota bacterium]
MSHTFKSTELYVTMKNKAGTLMDVTAPLADKGINIEACCAYATGEDAHFYLVTNNNTEAEKALKAAGLNTTKREVVVVETSNEAGVLNKASAKLAVAGVSLDYCYATTGKNGKTWVVFAAKDVDKALATISK